MSKRKCRMFKLKSNEILFLSNSPFENKNSNLKEIVSNKKSEEDYENTDNSKEQYKSNENTCNISNGTVGIIKSGKRRTLFMGTPENEEIAIFLEKDDIFVCSAFENGIKYEKAIKAMLYLLRDIESPINVLSSDNPTSDRLKLVISVGDFIELNCNLNPGTQTNQRVLCACDELSGTTIKSSKENIIIKGNVENYKIEQFIP